MDEDTSAAIVACAIVMAGWAVIAAPMAFFAHRRMTKVEASLQAQALPPNEQHLLFMSFASLVYATSALVAIMGFAKKGWARLGRNAVIVFIVQMTVAVLGACAIAVLTFPGTGPGHPPDAAVPLFTAASAVAACGAVLATVFAWMWVGRRAKRLQAQGESEGDAPGAWRFAVYAASLLLWPAGFLSVFVFSSANNVQVGAVAFRCTLLNVLVIALAVCVALPLVVAPQFSAIAAQLMPLP